MAGWLVLVAFWFAGGLLPALRGQVSFRGGQAGSGGTNPTVTVGNLSQVRWLDREGARSGPPITFVGVVTYSESQWKSLFVHDGTGSAFVYPPEGAQTFHAGDRVEVQGRVTEGYSAAIRADRIRFLGRGELPEPVPTELSDLDTGRHDCERVRVTTTIRWMFSMYGRLVMHFGESSARHELHLAEFNGPLPTNLLGARVEISAVSGVKMSEPGHLVGVRMAINGLDEIRVLTPAPIVPWDVPAQTIGTLMRFHPSTSFGQRTKLSGVVTLATP